MKPLTVSKEKLNDPDPKVRYGYGKELMALAKEQPAALYSSFDVWVEMLDNKNNIWKWTALDILGYLSAVDKGGKIDAVYPKIVKMLHGGHLITCGHAIFALGLIAQNKPEYFNKVIKEYIAISKDAFDTEECKRIAMGHVIKNLKPFVGDIKNNKPMLRFIENAAHCGRNATEKKAKLLMRKIGKT